MDIAFPLPEDIEQRLRERWGGELPRRALEALAAQSYRDGTLTLAEVRRMLGHESRFETEAFLKEAGAYLHYTKEDLEKDAKAIREGRS